MFARPVSVALRGIGPGIIAAEGKICPDEPAA